MKILAVVAAILVFASIARAGETRPAVLADVGIDQRLNAPVPLDLPFRDETGKTVKLGDYFGDKPVVLALVYYECPMLCTLTLNGLVRAMRALPFDAGQQYTVVTVSFNPRETWSLAAAKKRGYLASYRRPGGAEGWHFLTGDESSIRPLAEAVGFHYHYDPPSGQYAHATGLTVLTPQGRISRYFFGVEFSPRDLRLALEEASANHVGSPVDALLLFCCRYDPATGRYNLVIGRVLQLAGGATVLALGGFLGLMVWREKRGNRKRLEVR